MRKRIEKISGSGITVDGKTLEEIVAAEEGAEILDELEKEVVEKKKSLYHGPRGERNDKGRASITKVWTQLEINQKKWKENLMALNKETTSISQLVIGAMMDGAWMTPAEIAARIKETTGREIKTADASWRITSIRRSPLAPFIQARKRDKRKWEYTLVHCIVVHCSPADVFALHLKSRKDITAEILAARHPDIAVYLQRLEKKQVKRDLRANAGAGPEVAAVELPAAEIKGVIEEAVSKALGLDVTIAGKIEVVFRFVVGEPK